MKPATLLFAVSLLGCQGPRAEALPDPEPAEASVPAAGEAEMRTYEVPQGRAEEVTRVLRRALSQGADTPPRGTANQLDDGRVVVLAPPSVHTGVAQLCTDLRELGAVDTQTIEISYWLVVARPQGDESAAPVPDVLSAAIAEIREQDGPASFSLLESTRLASLGSSHAETQGLHAKIEQEATVVDGDIVADIEVDADRGSSLRTRLPLSPGELVVVGHSGRQTVDQAEARLYFIVRATAV